MYSSETISRNMSTTMSGTMMFPTTTTNFKHGLEGEFLKSNKDTVMVSDLFQQQQNHHSGGLTRYRSAPSSFFASLMDGNNADGTNTVVSSSHSENEAETIFSTIMNCSNGSSSGNMEMHDLNGANHQLQFSANSKQETVEYDQQQNGFSSEDLKFVYENTMNGSSNGNGSYGAAMENRMQVRMNGNENCSSNLIRQSSSPAGFFSGYDVMRELGSFRASNGTHAECNSTSSGLNNHMNFTSQTPPFSRFVRSIAENGNENIGSGSLEDGNMGSGNNTNGRSYVPGFSNDCWNNSTSNSLKRNRDGDVKIFSCFNGLENQNGDGRHFMSGLTHHLSLPKTSAELAAVEKFLQFEQDVVPCKIRAKRGFATHPRSIAERVRRTRISERMKKLQELFPEMDKQANTSDMLDMAVEFIKDLQKQVQTLMDTRAKCTCASK